jgi:DNA-binding Xre family transcriptional regulator
LSTITLKLKEFLGANGLSAYRLQKDSGLAASTVYALAQNRGARVDLGTFAALMDSLERLTDGPVAFDDLLERKRARGRPKNAKR